MKIGNFLPNAVKILQIEKATQVHQLVSNPKKGEEVKFLDCKIRVWNNRGQIIPPMKLRDLVVLNGDEYPVQVGFALGTNNPELIVLTYEICDEGSINKPVYVELDCTTYGYDVELDSIDVYNTTAVRVRNYNLMNIVSPALLPKNSVCIFNYGDILSLQKNNDLMGYAEILTHSNCILREGTLSELHPVVYDDANSTMEQNHVYTALASYYRMGYNAASGKVIIVTGNDEFLLSPKASGCEVLYCEKKLTEIASQVHQALVSQKQTMNVDSNEFASAVASVGRVAEKNGLTTGETQSVANKVVPLLPSVKIAQLANVKDFNLSSEKPTKSGLRKTL